MRSEVPHAAMMGLQQTIRLNLTGVELEVSRCTESEAYVTFWLERQPTEDDWEDVRWILAEMDVDEFLEWIPTVRSGTPEFSVEELTLYARDGGAPAIDVSWMNLDGEWFVGSLRDHVAAYLAVAAESHCGIVNVWSVGDGREVNLLVDVARFGTLLGDLDAAAWSRAVSVRFRGLSESPLKFEYRDGELGRWNPPAGPHVGIFTRSLV